MASSDRASFIGGLPKAELHLHIEGTLEPELKLEIANRNGISLPYSSAAQARAAYSFHDLTSFLVGYYESMQVLRVEQDFYDLAMAYFRNASAQHVVYAEIFFDPQAHTSRGVSFETVIGGLHRAAAGRAAPSSACAPSSSCVSCGTCPRTPRWPRSSSRCRTGTRSSGWAWTPTSGTTRR